MEIDNKINMSTLEDLKQIELNILKEFIAVCEKLNLKYYVIGGTLLGAIRHKGFIPWDDDIDVGMPRSDYEIFIKEGQKYFSNSYFVQTHETDPEFVAHFCKIRDSETTFIETNSKNLHINHGVFIDVFPLDYTDKKGLNFKLLSLKEASVYSFNKSFFRRIKCFLAGVLSFCFSIEKAFVKKEKIFKERKDGKYLANFSGAWGRKEIIPKEWYGEGVVKVFETLNVVCPTGYHKWLTQVYGDYMELPPLEKRITHHYTEIIDITKSYKEYRK